MPAANDNHLVAALGQRLSLLLPDAGGLADGVLKPDVWEPFLQKAQQLVKRGRGKGGLADQERVFGTVGQILDLRFTLDDIVRSLTPANDALDLRMLRIAQDNHWVAVL